MADKRECSHSPRSFFPVFRRNVNYHYSLISTRTQVKKENNNKFYNEVVLIPLGFT